MSDLTQQPTLFDSFKQTLADKSAGISALGLEDGLKRGLTKFYQGAGMLGMAAAVIYGVSVYQAKDFEQKADALSKAQPAVQAVLAKHQQGDYKGNNDVFQGDMAEAQLVTLQINQVNEIMSSSGGKMTPSVARKLYEVNPYLAAVAATIPDNQRYVGIDVPNIQFASDYAERISRGYGGKADKNSQSKDGLYWERVILPGGYYLDSVRKGTEQATNLGIALKAAGVSDEVAKVILSPESTVDQIKDVKLLPAQVLALERVGQTSLYARMNNYETNGKGPMDLLSEDQKAGLAIAQRFVSPGMDAAASELVAKQHAVKNAKHTSAEQIQAGLTDASTGVRNAIESSTDGSPREKVIASMFVSGMAEQALDPKQRAMFVEHANEMANSKPIEGYIEGLDNSCVKEVEERIRPPLTI